MATSAAQHVSAAALNKASQLFVDGKFKKLE